MRTRLIIPEDLLRDMYLERMMSTWDISDEIGVSQTAVCRNLHDLGIIRSASEATVLAVVKYGSHGCAKIGNTMWMNRQSRKGKKYEEIYDENTIVKLKELASKRLSGKTYEEIYGEGRAAEIRIKQSRSMSKHYESLGAREVTSKIVTDLWKQDDYRRSHVEGIIAASQYRPNSLEMIFNSIISGVCGKDFMYNGDGRLGTVGGMVPDWVSINGRKQVIELFGCYWHACPYCHFELYKGEWSERGAELTAQRIEGEKRSKYKEIGWDCLIIWEHELSDRELVERKLVLFASAAEFIELSEKEAVFVSE